MQDLTKQQTFYVAKYSPKGRQYEIKDHKHMTEASPQQVTNLSRRHWPMKQLQTDCSRLIPSGRGLSFVLPSAALPIEIKSRHGHNNTTPHPLPGQDWKIIFIHLFDSNGIYSRDVFLSYDLCVEAVSS
jgi:hypothetical protein